MHAHPPPPRTDIDSCVGIRYCPVGCPLGTLCDYSKGPYHPHCDEGVCSPSNVCVPPPPMSKCLAGERAYHGILTAAYGGTILLGVGVHFLCRSTHDASVVLGYTVAPGVLLLLTSGIFLAVCFSSHSVAFARPVAAGVLAGLFLFCMLLGVVQTLLEPPEKPAR